MTESYSCLSDSHQRLDPVSIEVKVKLPLTLWHGAQSLKEFMPRYC